MARASASECTATVAIPSSRHVRITRTAISPRLAIRTLSIIAPILLQGNVPVLARRGRDLVGLEDAQPAQEERPRLSRFDHVVEVAKRRPGVGVRELLDVIVAEPLLLRILVLRRVDLLAEDDLDRAL